MTDFEAVDHGTIIVLTPHTAAARSWVSEHIPDDAQRWAGGVAIERRYFEDIWAGVQADGLTVS